MKTSITVPIVLAAALFLNSNAMAGDNLWFGVKAGTLGLGVEASWRPIPWLDFRIGANQYDYDDSGSVSGINYDATLALQSYHLTGNFRFPVSPFRLTVGAFSNGNEVQMVGRPAQAYLIGDNPIPYAAADVGTLTSTASFDSIAPYVGAGFDFEIIGRLGLSLDFGVLLQGEPAVALTADGLLANDPGFIADLETERLQLQNEAEDLKAYPVISLGFNFNF
jgi:hypothetical protein